MKTFVQDVLHSITDAPTCEEGLLPCLTGGCYSKEQRCDGEVTCSDHSDESGCPINIDPWKSFRLYRISRLFRFYDPDDGDWAWRDTRSFGSEIQVFPIPKRPQNWVYSMFAVGKELGLGIMPGKIQVIFPYHPIYIFLKMKSLLAITVTYLTCLSTDCCDKDGLVIMVSFDIVLYQYLVKWLGIVDHMNCDTILLFGLMLVDEIALSEYSQEFDSAGPFMIYAEAPPVARMWEQVGIRACVFNFHNSIVGVLVTLPQSEDYQSIAVEKNGVVESYNPRRIEGTFQHIIWLQPGESYDVNIPIIFKRMGIIEVTVEGATQMQKDSQTVTIEVVAEGAGIGLHTSIILDLKDRALVYEFLDIPLDESPIIPYSLQRRYVFGTPSGSVSICGDIVGPSFPDIPMSEGSMIGFGSIGAETSSYNFGVNIWTLHYLRLTNQLTDDLMYKVLTAVNVDYAALARFQTDDGSFSNWIGSEPSVWLTAYALRILLVADFQDWENYIYIDRNIIHRGIQWLLDYQTKHGSFHETEHYLHPLDPKVDPRVARRSWRPRYQNVSLTAHVVITLQSVMLSLEGDLHIKANLAKQRAVRYLEKILNVLTDPYDLALVTWALMKSDSKEKNYAFSELNKIKRVEGDRIYWSREAIPYMQVQYEDNQKPYLQPKGDNRWDAHAVETTAYALLVYIKSEGIGFEQEKVVRFLNSMREMDGGMISSIDSLVALEALVEYSYRARIRDITNMNLNGVFGHIDVVGRGSGQALLQLSYGYGVDIEDGLDVPPVPSFDFNLEARFWGRNNSYVTITSCQRWINTNETETSGLTVVSIHLPSGYYIMQDELIEMVNERKVRNLRWALISDTDVKFFFNRVLIMDSESGSKLRHISPNRLLHLPVGTMVSYPVSNLSRHNMAQIYELYQPERFKQLIFEVFPLYALDICEVCGSYQCPYCPFYSVAANVSPLLYFIILQFLSIYILRLWL
ncbi:Antigen [Armadillidium nasatum]|uniref:Antigen n=1 Tax=Armadillidium nasatum TaxID=96803 RepID=A0A5N5T5A4_9CRUS|nr:Antigen [Armadillidium nasatum]